jgi:hypothetical protein
LPLGGPGWPAGDGSGSAGASGPERPAEGGRVAARVPTAREDEAALQGPGWQAQRRRRQPWANRPRVPGRRTQPAVTEHHSGVPEVDPELLAVLRLIRAAFGDVEVLEVIDDTPASGQPRRRAGYLTTAHPGLDESQEQADGV